MLKISQFSIENINYFFQIVKKEIPIRFLQQLQVKLSFWYSFYEIHK